LRRTRRGTSFDAAGSSVDQRTGRENEQNHQRGTVLPLLLWKPGTTSETSANFINAYNFAKRLKALNGLTPYEFIVNVSTTEPNSLPSIPPSSIWDHTRNDWLDDTKTQTRPHHCIKQSVLSLLRVATHFCNSRRNSSCF
jgi:hypothetical protein